MHVPVSGYEQITSYKLIQRDGYLVDETSACIQAHCAVLIDSDLDFSFITAFALLVCYLGLKTLFMACLSTDERNAGENS